MSDLFARPDLWCIGLYMAAMLFIGWRVTSGSRTVEGYTVGDRSIPGWAVGMSVLGTFLSSITFLALPAAIYADGNWNSFVFSLALPVAGVIAVKWFIPLYRGRVEFSAYEFLEQRFGYWARAYAAASFVVLQLLRVAMVLLLVALAVEPLLHWGVVNTLVALGVIVIVYDVMGGIRAVVWTDVIQVVVLLGAALWCCAKLLAVNPGSVEQFWKSVPDGTFNLGDWASWNLTKSTALVVFLYGLSENIRNYGTDQNYVQRMLATSSEHEARKAIWIGTLAYPPISVLFCLIGTGLFVFYNVPPLELPATLEGIPTAGPSVPLPAGTPPDKVFPFFIQHELHPLGRGVLIAGIMAAAMSTIDSSLNSMSMVVFVDFVRRLRRRPAHARDILTLRAFTIGLGVLGTAGAAGIFWSYGDGAEALMKVWWRYAGVAGAGMFGLFLLAWLMPRLPSWGALVSVLASIPVLLWGMLGQKSPPDGEWGWQSCPLHPNLVGIAGFLALLAVGGILSAAVRLGLLRPNSRYSTNGQPSGVTDAQQR